MLGIPPEIILVYIAAALAALGAILVMLLGLSLVPLLQRAEPPSHLSNLSQMLGDRGQGRELESLQSLGFKFLGKCRESCGFMEIIDDFAFAHHELPVTCRLSQNSTGTISTSMYSDDGNDRFLVTTNTDIIGSDVDDPALFLQVDPIASLETILRAHVSALEVWEEDDFKPIQVLNLDEINSQSKRFRNHPKIRKRLQEAVLLPFGIGLTHVAAPTTIAWVAWCLLEGTPWAISTSIAVTVFGALSSVLSIHLLYSLFRQPNGKQGTAPQAKRITKPFRLPVESMGFAHFEFSNGAWANRIQNHRWAIVLGGVLLILLLNPFLVIPVLVILTTTRAKKMFAFKSLVSFNNQFLTRKQFTFFGENNRISNRQVDQKLHFKDISTLRLEPGANDSIQLVADYSCSPRNDLFREASKAMRSKPTKEEVVESSLVIVDSLWGFDRDKIRELHKTLQQKRNLFSQNRT